MKDPYLRDFAMPGIHRVPLKPFIGKIDASDFRKKFLDLNNLKIVLGDQGLKVVKTLRNE